MHDQINTGTNETGKALMNKFSSEFEKLNKIEDEIIRLANVEFERPTPLNTWARRAFPPPRRSATLWTRPSPSSIARRRPQTAPKRIRPCRAPDSAWEMAKEFFLQAGAANDADELNKDLAAVKEQVDAASKATQQAAAAVATAGVPPGDMIAANDRLVRIFQKAEEISGGEATSEPSFCP